jgi:serine/threonine-protein kinase HipA
MVKTLDVYWDKKKIGYLRQDQYGEIQFTYALEWLQDPQAKSISCSLPLQEETFQRKACQAFFAGILPEEHQRRLIAKILGISPENNFSMLEKIGGECAGALSFLPSGENLIHQDNSYKALDEKNLYTTLQALPTRPLLVGDEGVRLSLAGVQDKLAVYIEGETIFLPHDTSPTTHIIKPDFNICEGVIFNEAFCLQLAKAVGLLTAEAQIKKIDDLNYLIIKRYDRYYSPSHANPKLIQRLHQEDFCQALNIFPHNKYQSDGGPSLKQCFELIRREFVTPVTDLAHMLNAVIFNYLIGNCDAHGKNFSILTLEDGLHLAPLYDLICTLCYKELTTKMAMKIGGEYKINSISIKNFEQFAEEIGFSKPEVKRRISKLIEAILSALPQIEIHHEIQNEVANIIKTRCTDF